MDTHLGLKARRLGAIALIVFAVVGASAAHPGVSAGAARAACYGGSCFNHDPAATGCDATAVTVFSRSYTAESWASWRIDMRYSPSCGAGWLRMVVYSGYNIGFATSAWNPNGPSVGLVGHNGSTTWTEMVDATQHRQVCGGSQFYVNGRWVRWYFYGCYSK